MAAVDNSDDFEKDDFLATEGQTVFTASKLPYPPSIEVYRNGQLQADPQVTVNLVGDVTLADPTVAGDTITLKYTPMDW